MKHFVIIALVIGSLSQAAAQQPTTKDMYQTAKNFMQQGDYDNATLIFNNLLKQEPDNVDVLKDFAYLNCLKREYPKAISIGIYLTEKPDADVQSFQVLGIAYKGSKNYTSCAKLYQTALAKFPNSGVLYNEYGELLALDGNLPIAIQAWQTGIVKDPNYANNYYNAIMYFDRFNKNLLWQLLYGEIFINLESFTQRTAEIKSLLLDGYKKMYTEYDVETLSTDLNLTVFERSIYQNLAKTKAITSTGVTPENITAIRTRFVLDWFYNKTDEKQPYQLFNHHQYLIREGMFDAYNQWLFGVAASPSAYQIWLNTHDKEAAAFKQYQQNKVFKLH
ncbi:MAG: tetratricopeptide repeat protein [Flavobacterium sp.]|nr:tetratricopeptide repeat protein [Flavobacterium sp.]